MDRSPTTPELGDDNNTATRRLERRNDRPTEGGFEVFWRASEKAVIFKFEYLFNDIHLTNT